MDSEVQRGMESIKSENQAGSALIQTLLFLAGDYVALVLAGVFSLFIRNELITRTVFHVSPAYLYIYGCRSFSWHLSFTKVFIPGDT